MKFTLNVSFEKEKINPTTNFRSLFTYMNRCINPVVHDQGRLLWPEKGIRRRRKTNNDKMDIDPFG